MILRAIITLSLLAASSALSKDKLPFIPDMKDGEWSTLFDGKSLNGWSVKGGDGKFEVIDGCIRGFGENVRGNTFLCTDKTYTDFILYFEVKFADLAGNSGVMFRANQKPSEDGKGRVYGYQCEHDNDKARAWTAGLYDEARRGWLFPKKDKSEESRQKWFTEVGQKSFNWEGWNSIVIRCKGNHIQTWLNGVKRVDYLETDPENDTREGFFGMQVHGGKKCDVYWRHIKITELK